MKLYLNLWEVMKKKKITWIELAKLSWISPEHISKMRNWATEPIKLWTVEKLLNSLDVKIDELLIYKKE